MTERRLVQLALLADGPSDEALIHLLRWAVLQVDASVEFLPHVFQVRRPPGDDIAGWVARIQEQYRPDLLFVHRDAERSSFSDRRREIPDRPTVVPVVPVRMTEAWLLIDEVAIRSAAGNPNGSVKLELPPLARLEEVPDPKRLLQELLVQASEFRGRRRKLFERAGAPQRVAQHIASFAPLRSLPSFHELERELARAWMNLPPPRSGTSST